MFQIIGWCVAVAVGAIMTFNGTYMLISPRAWFCLPSWLRANGSLIEEKYADGWGAIQVRLAGAFFLGTVGWVLYDLLIR